MISKPTLYSFFQFWHFEDSTLPSACQKVKPPTNHLENTVHMYKPGNSFEKQLVGRKKWLTFSFAFFLQKAE